MAVRLSLSEQLRQHRAKLGLSQRAYAKRVGLHYRTVQNLEDGEVPRLSTLLILAEDMALRPDKLIDAEVMGE